MRAIGGPLTAAESEAMIAACRTLIHRVPFRHQGRKPAIGLDCAGLVLWGLKQIGRPVVDVRGYGTEPHKNGLRDAIEANLGPTVSDMRAGDVVLMRFHGAPRHVALLTTMPEGHLGMIHVHADNKVVSEHSFDGYWGDVVAVWRP